MHVCVCVCVCVFVLSLPVAIASYVLIVELTMLYYVL